MLHQIRGNIIKEGKKSGAVKKKNVLHCLSISSLRAVHWCLMKKEDRRVVIEILFSLSPAIHYILCKSFSWWETLTFQECTVSAQGRLFRGDVCVRLPSAVCQREMGEKGCRWEWRRGGTRRCLISGVLSHTGM